jgi:metal-dependent amidase/aminoacylase/carboxypeptidase family protein
VVSLTVIEGGEAQNQVPRRVAIRGTIRWLHEETGDAIKEGLQRITDGVAATCGVKGTLIISPGLGVTANTPAERDLAAAAAASVTETRRDMRPAMTGEDFAWFLKEVPGAFVWIGNGPAEEGRDLHNACYDFNDAILPTASKFLTEVAKRALAGA